MKYLLFLFATLAIFNHSDLAKRSLSCDFELPEIALDCTLDIADANKADGFTTLKFQNSQAKKAHGHFENGLPIGYWKFYHKNGELHWEGNYPNSQMSGFFSMYYESGRVRERGHYENCQRDGYWNFYFDNKRSQVQYKGHFENGVPVGFWQEFSKSGKIVSQFECK